MSKQLNSAEFITALNQQGITLWAEGDTLKFNAPAGGLSPAQREQLVARKAEMLAFLSPVATVKVNGNGTAHPFAAPQNSAENAIATVWQSLLKTDQVDRHASFFELGGDSITATQFLSWVRQQHAVELPLRDLFSQPTVAHLAQRIATLAQTTPSAPAPLAPLPSSDAAATGRTLSFAQQRLWFLDQLKPQDPFYNMPKALHLRGSLDLNALNRALSEIVCRHETLRSYFVAVAGEPRAFVAPPRALALTPTLVEEEALIDELAAETQRPFVLTNQDGGFRPKLFQLTPQHHVLLLTLHHIATDGWSIGILLRELTTLYAAYVADKPSPLAPLPLQYADFSAWQTNSLQGDRLQNHLDYWREQLATLSTLALPTDRPRPPLQSTQGAQIAFSLPATLTDGLMALGKQASVTQYMLLAAAFQTLLHRYSGQDDIVIGSPTAGRDQAEIEGLIGFFVNVLVLRSDLSGQPSFRDLLSQVRETALAAYEHQALPFEKLVGALEPERDLSRTPLYQVQFALQNAPLPALELPALTIESLPFDKGTAAFDIDLSMWHSAGQLHGRIEYSTALFNEERIGRLIAHFQQLLTAIVASPDKPISDLTLLTAHEQQQIATWNATTQPFADQSCIQHLFEQQAARTPDHIAATFSGESYSYQTLNQRANRLAHFLQAQGVGVESVIGLCVDRSLDMLVAMLAILKAGAAYLPLDPAFPTDRINYMIGDAQLAYILTAQTLSNDWPFAQPTRQLIPIDGQQPTVDGYPSDNPNSPVSATNLAYIIYTSGSTGRPKGVELEHRSVVNFLASMRRQPGLMADDRLLAVTTLSFDIAVLELLLPLTVGAEVVIVSRAVASDGVQLLQQLESTNISVMQATPATWRLLLAAGWQGSDTLNILCGGEALSADLATALLPKGRSLWNLYGPTETTIWSAAYQVKEVIGTVPIGRPIDNTQLYLLDKQLQTVPVGIVGDLYVGGAGLARGYFGRKELTAQRFIPNPFSNDPTARLYNTGDQGSYRSDGTIDFLGRSDHQVKIRGFRIELGEIESLLSQHPDVAQAVLTTYQDAAQSTALAAYIIASNLAQPPTVETLRDYLRGFLPDYMLPAAFIFLAAYPLTNNSKIDRNALPLPDDQRPVLETAFVAPRSALEQQLAAIWRELLAIEAIGVHDNFFMLGGHSLLSIRLLAKVREELSANIALVDFFAMPTIAHIAELCAVAAVEPDDRLIKPVARDKLLPLSFAQQRLWFLYQYDAASSAYNIPFALRLTGKLDVAALEQSIAHLLERHEILRTTYQLHNEQPVARIDPPSAFSMTITPIADEAQLKPYVIQSVQLPFDLTQQVARFELAQVNDEDAVLLSCIHHIALDGFSIGIIASELAALYNGYRRGTMAGLAPQPIQYADYAVWQRDWLSGENWQRMLDYWQAQLVDAPAALPLPTDFPYPAQPRFVGDKFSINVSAELLQSLRTLCRRKSATMYTVLLATYQWLLYRYTKQTKIPVGSPYASREREALASLVGCFMNTLVVATPIEPDDSFATLLKRVSDTVLGGIAHADMPFDKLVSQLDTPRTHKRSPVFQTVFTAKKSNSLSLLDFDGLSVKPVNTAPNTAKFELSLGVTEWLDRMLLVFEYNSALFSAETIQTLGSHYQTLLETITSNFNSSLHAPTLLLSNAESSTLSQLQRQLDRQAGGDAVVAPIRDAPQGVQLGIWSSNPLPASTVKELPIISVEQLPRRTDGEVDFGRLPQPATPKPAAKPIQSRAEQLAARRAKLAARRKGLSTDKQQKLKQLVKQRQSQPDPSVITKRDPTASVPLSFSQETPWQLQQLAPASVAFNMPLRIAFYDPIDASALAEALNIMLARHEVLRTAFVMHNGAPIQQPAPTLTIDMPLITVADDAAIKALSIADANRPFDLTLAPLLRARLLQHPAKSVLLLTFHHAIMDAWSWGLFVTEITTLYAALLASNADALRTSPELQYADYTLWQRQQLATDSYRRQLSYWIEQLRGAQTVLNLPNDNLREPQPRLSGARHVVTIDAQRYAALQQTLQSDGITLYILLTSVFGLVLQQACQQDDLIIGSVVANRKLQTETMLGDFTNMLPMRLQVDQALSFRGYVHSVKQTILDGFANQDVALSDIVAAINPRRDGDRQALIQACLVLQNAPAASAERLTPRMKMWAQMSAEAKYDLLFNVTETATGIRLGAVYNADRMAASTVEKMVQKFASLLENLTAESQISSLNSAEYSPQLQAAD